MDAETDPLDRRRYIATTAALEELCAELAGSPWLAVDTEFFREKTYYPQLCLLQVANPTTLACIDPLAIESLQPLLSILQDGDCVKILHAARQDMEIFYHLFGTLPAPVFDTQVAAPLLGHPTQASFTTLVTDLLGAELPKDCSRTDWRKRPLTNAQLRYAAADAYYLGLMYERLRDELAARGRLAWLDDDMRALSEPDLYRNEPELAWQRIRAWQRLRPAQLAGLQALAAWREATAQSLNTPRSWLVRDETLVDLARARPGDKAALARVRGLPSHVIDEYGEQLLTALRDAAAATPPSTPRTSRAQTANPNEEALVDALMAFVRLRGMDLDINPAIIASRSDILGLIQHGESPLLQGWKRTVIGEDLLRLLGGELSLQIRQGRLYAAPVK